jgi:hypothetical protein
VYFFTSGLHMTTMWGVICESAAAAAAAAFVIVNTTLSKASSVCEWYNALTA